MQQGERQQVKEAQVHTTVTSLTQLLVAVHSITHDVQSQHHCPLLALHCMAPECDVTAEQCLSLHW